MPISESRRRVVMLCFGFLSGLPLPLTIFTLQQWFTTYGISLRAIGFTAWIGLPYTLKFLWSALFDRKVPRRVALGRRRFWLLLIQPALALSCALLALSDPGGALVLTLGAALLLAFFSASQDIVIDAWRIETFEAHQQGTALALYIWGYRAAMLTSGAGVIYVSTLVGWHVALLLIAALLASGVLITLAAPEPAVTAAPAMARSWRQTVESAFLAPLREFIGRKAAWRVLAFVLLFRMGKVFADNQAAPLYRYRLGFTSKDVAAANAFELPGTLAGAAFGGWLVARFGARRALLGSGVFVYLSLGLYLLLLRAGHSQAMLTAKVVIEMFAQGTVDTCFLAYISTLCSARYTATQYALLSSLAAVALHLFSGFSGFLIEALGYDWFFVTTMLGGLPALLILWHLGRVDTAPADRETLASG